MKFRGFLLSTTPRGGILNCITYLKRTHVLTMKKILSILICAVLLTSFASSPLKASANTAQNEQLISLLMQMITILQAQLAVLVGQSHQTGSATSVTVVSPKGGEIYKVGDKILVSFSSTEIGQHRYKVELVTTEMQSTHTFNLGTVFVSGVNLSSIPFYIPLNIPPAKSFQVQITKINLEDYYCPSNTCEVAKSGFFSINASTSNTLPELTVMSPNGGETIPYGNIVMAGDLGFLWATSLGEKYFPTKNMKAYVIDSSGKVLRNDPTIFGDLSQGNGIFATSFSGELNLKTDTKYKIKVCDYLDSTGKQYCDVSDGYFIIK